MNAFDVEKDPALRARAIAAAQTAARRGCQSPCADRALAFLRTWRSIHRRQLRRAALEHVELGGEA